MVYWSTQLAHPAVTAGSDSCFHILSSVRTSPFFKIAHYSTILKWKQCLILAWLWVWPKGSLMTHALMKITCFHLAMNFRPWEKGILFSRTLNSLPQCIEKEGPFTALIHIYFLTHRTFLTRMLTCSCNSINYRHISIISKEEQKHFSDESVLLLMQCTSLFSGREVQFKPF